MKTIPQMLGDAAAAAAFATALGLDPCQWDQEHELNKKKWREVADAVRAADRKKVRLCRECGFPQRRHDAPCGKLGYPKNPNPLQGGASSSDFTASQFKIR